MSTASEGEPRCGLAWGPPRPLMPLRFPRRCGRGGRLRNRVPNRADGCPAAVGHGDGHRGDSVVRDLARVGAGPLGVEGAKPLVSPSTDTRSVATGGMLAPGPYRVVSQPRRTVFEGEVRDGGTDRFRFIELKAEPGTPGRWPAPSPVPSGSPVPGRAWHIPCDDDDPPGGPLVAIALGVEGLGHHPGRRVELGARPLRRDDRRLRGMAIGKGCRKACNDRRMRVPVAIPACPVHSGGHRTRNRRSAGHGLVRPCRWRAYGCATASGAPMPIRAPRTWLGANPAVRGPTTGIGAGRVGAPPAPPLRVAPEPAIRTGRVLSAASRRRTNRASADSPSSSLGSPRKPSPDGSGAAFLSSRGPQRPEPTRKR